MRHELGVRVLWVPCCLRGWAALASSSAFGLGAARSPSLPVFDGNETRMFFESLQKRQYVVVVFHDRSNVALTSRPTHNSQLDAHVKCRNTPPRAEIQGKRHQRMCSSRMPSAIQGSLEIGCRCGRGSRRMDFVLLGG
ncbi:hypothetical protein K443DRAFT_645423 [Laccaria amethystina LaAM-08-1]|uniref:Secreted protein n=1 Tax=Laccaria amethystina LaAM-08-1 TaxID=1095629 RepID=A0A0C9WXF1_9AGAR|nr:hypothetical protein K443DRAFT_645423 [Laccaria amethystina LaAM-08-1]